MKMIGVACDPLQHTSMYQRAEEGISGHHQKSPEHAHF